MEVDENKANEFIKLKLVAVSTSALIMMLSNGVYASSETPASSTINNGDINQGTEIVQMLEDTEEGQSTSNESNNIDETSVNEEDNELTNNENGTQSAPLQANNSENIDLNTNNNSSNNSNGTQSGSNRS